MIASITAHGFSPSSSPSQVMIFCHSPFPRFSDPYFLIFLTSDFLAVIPPSHPPTFIPSIRLPILRFLLFVLSYLLSFSISQLLSFAVSPFFRFSLTPFIKVSVSRRQYGTNFQNKSCQFGTGVLNCIYRKTL